MFTEHLNSKWKNLNRNSWNLHLFSGFVYKAIMHIWSPPCTLTTMHTIYIADSTSQKVNQINCECAFYCGFSWSKQCMCAWVCRCVVDGFFFLLLLIAKLNWTFLCWFIIKTSFHYLQWTWSWNQFIHLRKIHWVQCDKKWNPWWTIANTGVNKIQKKRRSHLIHCQQHISSLLRLPLTNNSKRMTTILFVKQQFQ